MERSVIFGRTVVPGKMDIHVFYRQLEFSSEPGIAHEIILENEPKSCLKVALKHLKLKFYS